MRKDRLCISKSACAGFEQKENDCVRIGGIGLVFAAFLGIGAYFQAATAVTSGAEDALCTSLKLGPSSALQAGAGFRGVPSAEVKIAGQNRALPSPEKPGIPPSQTFTLLQFSFAHDSNDGESHLSSFFSGPARSRGPPCLS